MKQKIIVAGLSGKSCLFHGQHETEREYEVRCKLPLPSDLLSLVEPHLLNFLVPPKIILPFGDLKFYLLGVFDNQISARIEHQLMNLTDR